MAVYLGEIVKVKAFGLNDLAVERVVVFSPVVVASPHVPISQQVHIESTSMLTT